MAEISLNSTLLAIKENPALAEKVDLFGLSAEALVNADMNNDGLVTSQEYTFYKDLTGQVQSGDHWEYEETFFRLVDNMQLITAEVAYRMRHPLRNESSYYCKLFQDDPSLVTNAGIASTCRDFDYVQLVPDVADLGASKENVLALIANAPAWLRPSILQRMVLSVGHEGTQKMAYDAIGLLNDDWEKKGLIGWSWSRANLREDAAKAISAIEDDYDKSQAIRAFLFFYCDGNNDMANPVIINAMEAAKTIKDKEALRELFDMILEDRDVFDRVNVLTMAELAYKKELGDKYVIAIMNDILENHRMTTNVGEILPFFASIKEETAMIEKILETPDEHFLKDCSDDALSYQCKDHRPAIKEAAAHELIPLRFKPSGKELFERLRAKNNPYVFREIQKGSGSGINMIE